MVITIVKNRTGRLAPILNIVSSNKNAVHGEVPWHHCQNDDSPALQHIRLQRTQSLHSYHAQPDNA